MCRIWLSITMLGIPQRRAQGHGCPSKIRAGIIDISVQQETIDDQMSLTTPIELDPGLRGHGTKFVFEIGLHV